MKTSYQNSPKNNDMESQEDPKSAILGAIKTNKTELDKDTDKESDGEEASPKKRVAKRASPKKQTAKKPAAKKKEPKPVYLTYEDFPVEDLLVYAGIDCVVSSELLTKMFPRLVEEPPYVYSNKGEKTKSTAPAIIDSIETYRREAFEFVIDMEINGIVYDVEKNSEVLSQMKTELKGLDSEIYSHIPKGVNLDSGASIGRYLYDQLGYEVLGRTKGGDPSTDGDTLKKLAQKTGEEWLLDLGKRNDIASLMRMFVENYVEDHVKSDGRIHPSYNLTGTSSFRITGENPNLTQLPRPKHGYNIREFFTVPEDYYFLTFDYSSAEVKILGALCKDPMLLKAIRENLDFHSFTASMINGLDYEEFVHIRKDENHPNNRLYNELRQAAKATTFGILYGSTVKGIARTLGMNEDEAEKLVSSYFKTYPGILDYINDTHSMTVDNRFVFSPVGQRKMEYGAQKMFRGTAVFNAAKRNAQNVRVQNLASSAGLHAFATLNSAIKPLGGLSLCTVYDSIELAVPKARAAECAELGFLKLNDDPVKEFDWLDYPIGVDAEIGTDWGHVTEIHRGISQKEIKELMESL